MTGFSPEQDTDHWGAALNATYRTDFFNVQYIGGYRDLHYSASHSTSGRNIDFPLRRAGQRVSAAGSSPPTIRSRDDFTSQERYYGNFSALIWDTTSESRDARAALHLARRCGAAHLGGRPLQVQGRAGAYSSASRSTTTRTSPYLEFNQGETIGESESVYADLTFALTDRLRVTGGARYSDESKERDRVQLHRRPRHQRRRDSHQHARLPDDGPRAAPSRIPTPNGDGVPNTVKDFVLLYQAGVAPFGVSDTLDEFLAGQCVQASAFQGTCAGYPGLGFAFRQRDRAARRELRQLRRLALPRRL